MKAGWGFLLALACSGCAGGRIYENGIKHCYLCAVRAARAQGYQVREQDFHPSSGELVAARSVPDLKETKIGRGFFRRAGEVLWNLWEHHRFELWDEDLAGVRIRTEERIVAMFKTPGGGVLAWFKKKTPNRTRVRLVLDVTEYGREDWVIARHDLEPAKGDEMYRRLNDCLGMASPTLYAVKPARKLPPAAAAPDLSGTLVAAAVTATADSASEVEASGPPAPKEPVAVAATPPAPVEPPPPAPFQEAAAPAAPTEALAAALTPEQVDEFLKKGRAAYEAGERDPTRFGEAVRLLERVVAADPENREGLSYLGAAYYRSGRTAEAIQTLEAYLRVNPADLAMKEFLDDLKRERQSTPGP